MLVKPKQIHMVQALPSKMPLCCDTRGNIMKAIYFLSYLKSVFSVGKNRFSKLKRKVHKSQLWMMEDVWPEFKLCCCYQQWKDFKLEFGRHVKCQLHWKISLHWRKVLYGQNEYVGLNPGKGRGTAMVVHAKTCVPKAGSSKTRPGERDLRWPAVYATVLPTAKAMLPSPQDLSLGWRSSWKLDQSFLWKINKTEMVRFLLLTSIHVRWVNYTFISHLFVTWSRNISVILHFSVKGF